MRERWVTLVSPALGPDPIRVLSLDGNAELNRLFRFDVVVARPGVALGSDDLVHVLETAVSLSFEEQGTVVGSVHGMVTEVASELDVEANVTRLSLQIGPRAWLLTQRRSSEMFLVRTIPEVIAEKLRSIGLDEGRDFIFSLHSRYPTREYVAQHEETDFAFVSRLCERWGIATFFESREGRDVFVFTDHAESYLPLDPPRVPVRTRRDHPAAYELKTTLRRVERQAEMLDYNYRTPRVSLRTNSAITAGAPAGDWIEYGANPKTEEETARLARIHGEAVAARHHVVRGKTTIAGIRAGGTVRLSDAAGGEMDLLVTAVEYHFRGTTSEMASLSWENEFTAIPRGVTFRPARVTKWPSIAGLMNATVDGEIKGDYAELDESGRYRLRLANDRSGRTNLNATHSIRMMQPHAGANYGMHFPLRPGAEVLLGYVNADPDRPVIVGSAPNPAVASPVNAENQTQNVLRTGSNNEIVIEDRHGSERVRIHTPHLDTTLQLGAPEEPEDGALLTTKGSISEASLVANTEATTTKTLVADTSASLVGRAAFLVAGSPGVTSACATGIQRPTAIDMPAIKRDLAELATPPEKYDPSEPAPNEQDDEDDPTTGLWSSIGEAVTELTEAQAMNLVRAAANTTDTGLDGAKGIAQGEPVGTPDEPAAVLASKKTVAMVGREVAFVFGDRVASLASYDTASVMGRKVAELKSPGTAEVAGAEQARVTSAREVDVEGNLVRVVGGYYPSATAPPLDPGTSVGVMSRQDLRMMSVEDCILVCANKHIIETSHTADIRLTAAKCILMNAGSIIGNAGFIGFTATKNIELTAHENLLCHADIDIVLDASANIQVQAAADLLMGGATVTISGGKITLDGPVEINGSLTVHGAINQG